MKLKIGHREGDYKINPNNTGVYLYSYKKNKDFVCIAKVFRTTDKKSGKEIIMLEPRQLTPPEVKAKRTVNYVRLNADLVPQLIELLKGGGKDVKPVTKSGKEERELEDLIGKIL